MQVKLVNILTYVPMLSYKNSVKKPHNSVRHEVQYKMPVGGGNLATIGSRFTGLLFTLRPLLLHRVYVHNFFTAQ